MAISHGRILNRRSFAQADDYLAATRTACTVTLILFTRDPDLRQFHRQYHHQYPKKLKFDTEFKFQDWRLTGEIYRSRVLKARWLGIHQNSSDKNRGRRRLNEKSRE
jgi:hypothetical protein